MSNGYFIYEINVVFVRFGLLSYYMCEDCVENTNGDYATIEEIVMVNEKELPTSLFYPNPITSGETITINPTESVVLYTMQGQIVFEKELKNNFSFELPHLKKRFLFTQNK